MSSKFLKVRVWLSRSPEVLSIAHDTLASPTYVVGALCAVWSWADDHGKNGIVPKASETHIDHVAECDGFAKAMQAVDWLIVDETGAKFPQLEANYRPSETASSADRVRRYRERKKAAAAGFVQS